MKDSRSLHYSSTPPPGLVGARHDDSSLFSLDALKRVEQDTASKRQEDSGLIDIKALASIERTHAQRPNANANAGVNVNVEAPVPAAGLFALPAIVPNAAPPLQLVPRVSSMPPVRSAYSPKMILAGAAVVATVAVVTFFVARGTGSAEAAPAPTATPSVAAAAPAAPPPVAAREEPKVVAVNPGERAASDPAPAKPADAPAPAAKAPVAAVHKAPAAAKPIAPKPAAAPKPAVDTCDLTCQMQRAVSKK